MRGRMEPSALVGGWKQAHQKQNQTKNHTKKKKISLPGSLSSDISMHFLGSLVEYYTPDVLEKIEQHYCLQSFFCPDLTEG